MWSATRRWWNSLKVELAQQVVVLGHLTFALKDLDVNTWLVVGVGGESLLLFGGNSCVSWDEDGHNFTGGLNTLRKSSDIE